MKIKTSILLVLIGISFISKANIIVVNGLTHQFKTEKGQTYRGKIEIQNIGKTSKNVKLYLQDLNYNSDGSTSYTQPGTNKLTNTNWLKFNTDYLTLEPGQKSEVFFELSVPESIVEEGSYWSTCIVEPVEDIKPNNTKGIQINSIIRYAIQIITDYSTYALTPKIKFEKINIDSANNQRIINIALANEGKVYTKTFITLELYNKQEGDKIEGDYQSQLMSLLPNTSKSFTINISKLKKGTYKVVAFAKDDQENVFAIEFELDV